MCTVLATYSQSPPQHRAYLKQLRNVRQSPYLHSNIALPRQCLKLLLVFHWMSILQVGSFWGLVEVLCLLFTWASCFSARSALQLVWCSHKMPHWRAYSNTANLMQILITSQQLPCRFLAGDIQLPHTVVEAMQMQVNLCIGHSLCVFFSGWT